MVFDCLYLGIDVDMFLNFIGQCSSMAGGGVLLSRELLKEYQGVWPMVES